MVEKHIFGITEDGREVFLYRIFNQEKEYAEVLSYGASLHSLYVKDCEGNLGDVVLGAADIDGFSGFSTEGVVVGRCANRIADARFEIDGRQYQLEQGRGGHCLHSESSNFAKQHFEGVYDENACSVTFVLEDMGACGFGCIVHVSITYSWNDAHQLIIDYHLVPEGDTLLSPTCHAYFNLGEGDAREHILYLDADRYAVKSERGLPEGEVASVMGTHLDFTKPRLIRGALADYVPTTGRVGFDDNYILNGEGFREIGFLLSPQTGRKMRILTDMPGLVLFASSLPMALRGKNERSYEGYCFVCLETQYISNAINCKEFKKPIFKKGEVLSSRTVYAFSITE